MKVFRDDIWGQLRTVFQADHRAYKQMGFYDFPLNDWEIRALNAAATTLLRVSRLREEFARRINSQMVQPYQKLGALFGKNLLSSIVLTNLDPVPTMLLSTLVDRRGDPPKLQHSEGLKRRIVDVEYVDGCARLR